MRATGGLAVFALTAFLSACAQSNSMPDIGLFGGGPEPATANTATAQGQITAEKPAQGALVASRNAKKPAPAKGGAAVASTKSSAAPATAPEKPAAKDTESSGFSLGNMAQMTLFSGSSGPASVETAAKPVAAYTMLAQQIHACWFTPGKPQLTHHGFHAEVAPDGSGDAKIIIYEKAPDNKRGIQVFRITISGSGDDGSVISSENRRLDATLEAAFKSDLARWAKGDERCRS